MALSQSEDDRRVGQSVIALDGNHSDLPINADVVVRAVTDMRTQVLTIPREALQTDGADHYVYVVEEGKLRRTPVEIGLLNSMRVEIRKGLKAQDTIALRAMSDTKLAGGMRVAIVQ